MLFGRLDWVQEEEQKNHQEQEHIVSEQSLGNWVKR